MTTPVKKPEPEDVLYRVQRGISAYVSYLAACEMNEAFSEYVLYEPILRILTARKFKVECEYECPGIKHSSSGDKKRVDFFAKKGELEIAIEVKWIKRRKPEISADTEKLLAFQNHTPAAHPLLCLFGRKTILSDVIIDKNLFTEIIKPRYASLGVTRYGCRIFLLKSTSQ